MTTLFLILISVASWGKPISHGKVYISDLHPTQAAVGMLEVDYRKEKFSQMKDKEQKEYLQERVVPVVVGPNGQFYMVDHHHLIRALYELGHDWVYFKIEEDLSDLSKKDFWKRMIKLNFVRLKDEKGNVISVSDLPPHVSGMGDDPYRSLAWMVEKLGGYIKTSKLYFEYIWADYFRTKMTFKNSKKGLEDAIPEAMEWARHPDASHLPGYIKGRRCGNLLK